MNKSITFTIALTTLISCSKSDTPTPVVEHATTTETPPYTYYYSSSFVEANMIGKWSIYKHTHKRYDSTYVVYPSGVNNVIEFTSNDIVYNTTPPEPYSYSNLDIQSTSSALHHYYVEDMNNDTNWMYLYTYTPSYVVGFDSVFYSLGRLN